MQGKRSVQLSWHGAPLWSLPSLSFVLVDAFHHDDKITPGHGVRVGFRIISGDFKSSFLKQFLVHHQTSRFCVQKLYTVFQPVDKDVHISIPDIPVHFFPDQTAQAFYKAKSASSWKLEDYTKKLAHNNDCIVKMTADYEAFLSRVQTDKEGNKINIIRLDGLDATDHKSVGTRLQDIAKNATTGGEYVRIGELYGFPLLVKTEPLLKDGKEVKQNRFFVEGAFKYTYNNGQIAMADTKAASMNFLNALERIPKLVEQYKAQNVTYERDIPILQETVGGVWKKEDELKALKAEVAALERKIQLTLTPPKPEAGQEQAQRDGETIQNTPDMTNGNELERTGEGQSTVTVPLSSSNSGTSQFPREHIVRPKPAGENMQSKGLKL